MIGTDTWLSRTREFQTLVGTLPLESERARTGYLKDMTLALFVETGEMLQRIDWKPWRSDRTTDREGAIEEAVDVLHFVANFLVALDVTDEELSLAYRHKHLVNRQRLLDTR